MRFHSLDGTEDIGALVRACVQHREVPRFQFFRAGVDQLSEKWFPTVQVRQGQHRADGLAQPLTDLIERTPIKSWFFDEGGSMFQRTVFILTACSFLILQAFGVGAAGNPDNGPDVVWESLPGWIMGAKNKLRLR